MECEDSRKAITNQIHEITKQFLAEIGREEAKTKTDKRHLEKDADKNTLKKK